MRYGTTNRSTRISTLHYPSLSSLLIFTYHPSSLPIITTHLCNSPIFTRLSYPPIFTTHLYLHYTCSIPIFTFTTLLHNPSLLPIHPCPHYLSLLSTRHITISPTDPINPGSFLHINHTLFKC